MNELEIKLRELIDLLEPNQSVAVIIKLLELSDLVKEY